MICKETHAQGTFPESPDFESESYRQLESVRNEDRGAAGPVAGSEKPSLQGSVIPKQARALGTFPESAPKPSETVTPTTLDM